MEFLTNEAPADTEGDDKDYTHLGAGIYVRKGDEDKESAQKYKKDDSGSLKAISDDEYQKTKSAQGQDGEKAAATTPQNQQGGDTQQTEEPPKGTSLKQGGYYKIIDKEAETRKKIDNEKNGISSTKSLVDIQDENTKSLESFIQKGFTDSEGATIPYKAPIVLTFLGGVSTPKISKKQKATFGYKFFLIDSTYPTYESQSKSSNTMANATVIDSKTGKPIKAKAN